MPTLLQGSASDTPTRYSCHLTCYKGRSAPGRTRTNCRQVQHHTFDLEDRLAQHEAGRGARLTQVQRQAGGTWRLADVRPGDRTLERRLKQHGAARRCPICKADAETDAQAEPEAGA